MTDFGCELVLTDFLNALDRFKHQMELQRASIAEVAAHQQEVDAGFAAAKQELNALHQEVGAKRRELEGLFA